MRKQWAFFEIIINKSYIRRTHTHTKHHILPLMLERFFFSLVRSLHGSFIYVLTWCAPSQRCSFYINILIGCEHTLCTRASVFYDFYTSMCNCRIQTRWLCSTGLQQHTLNALLFRIRTNTFRKIIQQHFKASKCKRLNKIEAINLLRLTNKCLNIQQFWCRQFSRLFISFWLTSSACLCVCVLCVSVRLESSFIFQKMINYAHNGIRFMH